VKSAADEIACAGQAGAVQPGFIQHQAQGAAMPKSTFAGHPLHPMLIAAPAALIPFAFVLDAMHRSTRDTSYSKAAYYSLVGGLLGGAAAATAGVMDYLTIPSETDVKRTANVHAMLNGGVMALTVANTLARRNTPSHRGGSLALTGLAALGIVVSSWFGGRMVYEQGMRVKGVSPVEDAPELKPPGDSLMEQAMEKQERLFTDSGPVM
jgi:uncharacterized membrane protein